ncbi:MAG: IclR family transcriptional regulator [Burkholderiales bacterium]|nr:IclR family transcriptional regulator [Burkholderiales bacterium]
MPRKSAQPSLADQSAAPGGVAAVDRALSLLSAFSREAPRRTLAELAAHCVLYKSTVLRLLASLEHAGLVRRQPDGAYLLGAEVARLYGVYDSSFSLEPLVLPALHALTEATGESAAFHVRQGDQRVCLYRVDSPHPIRDHIRAGDVLPLDRGTGGRVLLAFSGAKGRLYDRIRAEGHMSARGDRLAEVAGISAPVFGPGRHLLGALTLTLPTSRLDAAREARYVKQVREASQRLSAAAGADSR